MNATPGTPNYFYSGALDEVRLYAKALTVIDISYLYSGANTKIIQSRNRLPKVMNQNHKFRIIDNSITLNTDANSRITVTNLSGRCLFNTNVKSANTIRIPLDNYSKGIYVLRMFSSDGY